MVSADRIYLHAPHWLQTTLLNLYGLSIKRHRYGRRLERRLAELRAFERSDRQTIQDLQALRLQAMVQIAYRSTRHFRTIMNEHGIAPSQIRTPEDLRRLPLLEKDAIRASPAHFKTSSSLRRNWIKGNTSGTTGSPLTLWYDRQICVLTNAVDARQKAWGGMKSSDWIGLFLGRMIVEPERRDPPFWQPNHVQKQVWFSSFHMSDRTLGHYLEEIRRRNLRFLEGYPSTLYILARYVLSRGCSLPMKAVFTSSETLHRVQRETIESAFECRIHDFYGLAERVIFGAECEVHDGKHLAEDYGITEVVNADGVPCQPGEKGYLVGTSLWNEAMPLLRYRTSDLSAVLEAPCPCGRTLLRMEDVATKAEDAVVTPEGRWISPSVLTHPFKPFSQIRKSQIIQDEVDHVTVRIVPSESFAPALQEELRSRLSERLGSSMRIDIEVAEELPQETSGKFRWVISLVEHEGALDWNQAASPP